MRLGDLDALKEATKSFTDCDGFNPVWQIIDNAPTFDVTKNQAYDQGFITAMRLYSRPQGKCKGEFQLTELRRWLTSQGYSEGTVNDKINEFTGFVERIRGEE